MPFAVPKQAIQRMLHHSFLAELAGAEMLFAGYRTDPSVIARVLPKPLKPAHEPLVLAFVARYPRTNFGCAYREGALFVQCTYRGRAGGYCLAMLVDDDTALIAGREHHGFPKKMAERIVLEETEGARIGSVVRSGVELLRIELEPRGAADSTSLVQLGGTLIGDPGHLSACLTSYLFKFFPDTSGKGFDYLPRLVEQKTLFRPRPGLLRGTARVTLRSSARDPLADIPVVGEPIFGLYGTWDNTMLPGRTVARVWNPWSFLPYSFFRSDAMLAVLESSERQSLQEHRTSQRAEQPSSK